MKQNHRDMTETETGRDRQGKTGKDRWADTLLIPPPNQTMGPWVCMAGSRRATAVGGYTCGTTAGRFPGRCRANTAGTASRSRTFSGAQTRRQCLRRAAQTKRCGCGTRVVVRGNASSGRHTTPMSTSSHGTRTFTCLCLCVCVVCVVCIVYFSHVVMCLVLNPWLSLTSPFSFYLSLSVPTLPHTPSFPALHPRVCLCVHACFCLWCILHYLHLPPPSTGASRPPL